MRRNRQGFAFVAAGIAVSLALAGAAVAALHGHATAAGTVVKVTEREYHITLSRTVLPAGRVTFSVHNAGKLAHQLDLSGAGLRTVHLPTIAPGRTRSVTVKLGGGKLKVWCPVPGHAALGMRTSLKVKGATSSAGGGTAGGTTGGTTTTPGYVWG
ncbi:MAG: hypothetical protein ACYDCH_13050 [Gaiellaceae bacterium]